MFASVSVPSIASEHQASQSPKTKNTHQASHQSVEVGELPVESNDSPGAGTVGSLTGDAKTKTISQEFELVKRHVQQLNAALEKLGQSLSSTMGHKSPGDNESGGNNSNSRKFPAGNNPRNRKSQNYGRPSGSKWKTNQRHSKGLRVLEPVERDVVTALSQVDLKDATLKCMNADDNKDVDFMVKHILRPLVSGDDVVMQYRGDKLRQYTSYALIDALNQDNANLQAAVVISRLDAGSTRQLVEVLRKHIALTESKISLEIADDGTTSEKVQTQPRLFICTPPVLNRLKETDVIQAKQMQTLVVYEAEFVLRILGHTTTLQGLVDGFDVCQVILATNDYTDDVVEAQPKFGFNPDLTYTVSMDHTNLNTVRHFYYVDDKATTEVILNRAVEISKEKAVVIICRDNTDLNNVRNSLEGRATVSQVGKGREALLPSSRNGILLTLHIASNVLTNEQKDLVGMVFNICEATMTPERYLDTLASYVSLGNKCDCVTKVLNNTALKALEELSKAEFSELKADSLPF